MRLPWRKAPAAQLDLLDGGLDRSSQTTSTSDSTTASANPAHDSPEPVANAPTSANGLPLLVPIASIDEDPNNPRTEFPESEVDELAGDIRQHGILQPLVIHPIDADGRYRLHFGAKRLRAAVRAGLTASS